jgi:hypothetical protein
MEYRGLDGTKVIEGQQQSGKREIFVWTINLANKQEKLLLTGFSQSKLLIKIRAMVSFLHSTYFAKFSFL